VSWHPGRQRSGGLSVLPWMRALLFLIHKCSNDVRRYYDFQVSGLIIRKRWRCSLNGRRWHWVDGSSPPG
jgi:hypothetical protein